MVVVVVVVLLLVLVVLVVVEVVDEVLEVVVLQAEVSKTFDAWFFGCRSTPVMDFKKTPYYEV